MLGNSIDTPNDLTFFRDALRWQAELKPDKPALIFVAGRNVEATIFTFSELHCLALKVAAQLLKHEACGKKIGIPAANSIEFVAGLLGCLYVGAIAVPLPLELQGVSSARGDFILLDANLDFILCENSELIWLRSGIPLIVFSLTDEVIASFELLPQILASSTAIIQFTSGTGGSPAGVYISYQALSTNLIILEQAMGHTEKLNRICLNWCPFYHDMGLIGGLLNPIFTGLPIVQLKPIDFIKRPLLLLKCIDKYRITTCGGPTFGYQLLNSALSNLVTLEHSYDLSCWDAAFCGAEPVNASILEEFCQLSAPFSFNPYAILPCYGMAEFTLFISGAPFQTGMKIKELDYNGKQQKFVSCGVSYADTQIKVMDELGFEVKDDIIGEIYLSGASLLQGYWENEKLINVLDTGGFFATGDLGFLSKGEIYLTGRRKHLVKINGVGLFPHLIIDEISKNIPELDALKGIVLQPDFTSAKLFVFHELKRGVKLRKEAIAQLGEEAEAIAKRLTGSSAVEFVIVKTGFLQKTSSGKLVALNSERFVANLLGRIGSSVSTI